MWLWVGFCLASAVLSKNTIHAGGLNVPIYSRNSNCDEVQLKLWTILADLLNEDGYTVKIPSRDKVIYALTLIKKGLLGENSEYDNVPLKQNVLLREAALAKYKGVYLNDNRPLQTLLSQEIIQNEYQNQYSQLRTNDNPACREAFRKLMQSTYESYDNLANSHFCMKAPYGVLPSQITQYDVFSPENPYNRYKYPARIYGKDLPNSLNDLTPNRPAQANTFPNNNGLPNGQDITTGNLNNLLNAVNLSQETNNLLGTDYTATLNHAKRVADKIKKLYQPSNSYQYGFNGQRPLRNLNSNVLSINADAINTLGAYDRPLMQTNYKAQISLNTQGKINKDRDPSQENAYLYAPAQGIQNNAFVNQSYTLISNTMQSQAAASAESGAKNTFVNAKWQPNPAHFTEPIKEEQPNISPTPDKEPQTSNVPKLTFNMNINPYGSSNVPRPKNIAGFSDPIPEKIPTRTNPYQQPYFPGNQLTYNTYNLQNNAYKLRQNLNKLYLLNNYNKYQQFSALRPRTRPLLYQKRVLQVPGIKLSTQHSIYTGQNYLNQRQIGQQFMQMPIYQTSGPNVLNNQLQNGAYTRYVNTPFPQQNSNNNNQAIISKLASWISGTNPVKLNSDIDSEAEIELTYRVNKPPPLYQPTVFYVKFRMPYQQFAQRLQEFMSLGNRRSASSDIDLYDKLASQYNATVIPPDMTDIAEEDIKSPEGKVLVRARYIQPNESENDTVNSVDIINLDKPTEQKIENQVNNDAKEAETQFRGT